MKARMVGHPTALPPAPLNRLIVGVQPAHWSLRRPAQGHRAAKRESKELNPGPLPASSGMDVVVIEQKEGVEGGIGHPRGIKGSGL